MQTLGNFFVIIVSFFSLFEFYWLCFFYRLSYVSIVKCIIRIYPYFFNTVLVFQLIFDIIRVANMNILKTVKTKELTVKY